MQDCTKTRQFQGDNDICHTVSSCKAKKLLNTFMITGFESVETGNSIVTPQSYVVET